MDKEKELEILFNNLQTEELNKKEIGDDTTIVCQILRDGYVGSLDDFEKSNYKIMIVGAEAHDCKRIYNHNENIGFAGFFVKQAVLENYTYKFNRYERKYMNRLNLIYKCLTKRLGCKSEDAITNYRELKNIAYINLKKIGSGASIDKKIFYEWVDRHKELIARQINIIAPNYIVICGNNVHKAFYNSICDLLSRKIDIYISCHPSAYMSNTNFIESFDFDRTINKE